jgi:prophage regulatory protein
MKLLRIKHVMEATGLSRMTLWRLEKAGDFPTRRRLGLNSVAWLDSDIAAWIESRPRANTLGGAPRIATDVTRSSRNSS